MNKWFAASLGVVLGISHMGLVGLLVTRQKDDLPTINIPTTDYSTYQAEVTKDGYKIAYRANDPKTMYITKDIKEKAGFLGLANNTTKVVEEYVMDGKTNQGGAVSNKRSWIDNPPGLTQDQAAEISAQRIASINAEGTGEGTGRVVGNSIGDDAAHNLSSIHFVGWFDAGCVAMFGVKQCAEIGGNMSEDMSKDC